MSVASDSFGFGTRSMADSLASASDEWTRATGHGATGVTWGVTGTVRGDNSGVPSSKDATEFAKVASEGCGRGGRGAEVEGQWLGVGATSEGPSEREHSVIGKDSSTRPVEVFM